MRGAVVARVIPVLFETYHLEDIRDIHKVIRSNRVAFISLPTHGSLFFCFLSYLWAELPVMDVHAALRAMIAQQVACF